MKRITRIIRPIICMAVLLFAMTTAVMGCYQKETEPIDIPGRTPSGTSAPQPSATPAGEVMMPSGCCRPQPSRKQATGCMTIQPWRSCNPFFYFESWNFRSRTSSAFWMTRNSTRPPLSQIRSSCWSCDRRGWDDSSPSPVKP